MANLERAKFICEMASENEDALTDWEKKFVSDQFGRLDQYGETTRMSDKQMGVLEKIANKVGA